MGSQPNRAALLYLGAHLRRVARQTLEVLSRLASLDELRLSDIPTLRLLLERAKILEKRS